MCYPSIWITYQIKVFHYSKNFQMILLDFSRVIVNITCRKQVLLLNFQKSYLTFPFVFILLKILLFLNNSSLKQLKYCI